MAAMRLRWIHSFMVLTVVGLLVVYSAFLTSPSYVDSTLDGGESPGALGLVNSSLIQTKLLENAIADVAAGPAYESIISQLQNVSLALPAPEVSKTVFNGKAEDDSHTPLVAVNINANLVNDVEKKKTLSYVGKPIPLGPRHTVWTRDIYEPGFSYPNPWICPNDGQDLRLLVLISSAPSHFSARDAIRLTWGHYSQRLDVAIAFVIGKSENETVLEGIEMEKHLYNDLLVANFIDSYDNLTLKTMASLEWIETYCNQSQYVLKTDDDMFINVPNLLKFIDKIEEEDRKQPKLYGRLARKWKPVRNKKSKYYISFQQYRKTVYPDFTTGPAYLFQTRLAHSLFEKGMEKTYLKLEDVYTTGIVASSLAQRVNVPEFANKKVNFHKTSYCALSRLISMHMVAYHEQFELWKRILDGRTKCKIIYTNNANSISQQQSQILPLPQAGKAPASVTVTNSSSSSSMITSSSSSAGTTNNANNNNYS